MDILKPELVWIENRCFRKLQIAYPTFQDDDCLEACVGSIAESSTACATEIDSSFGFEDVEIVKDSHGFFKCLLCVASSYFRFIIGSKGDTKKRLELDTRCKIFVPSKDQDGDIVISGYQKSDVSSCVRRIQLLVQSGRQKHCPTHFLSIPFTDANIQSNMKKFRSNVMCNLAKERGIHESIFQIPERLHLTLGTIVLLGKKERQDIEKYLNDCADTVIRPKLKDFAAADLPLKIHLKGLEYMNDDPGEVDVLYAKLQLDVKDSNFLQSLCDEVVQFFFDRGVVVQRQNCSSPPVLPVKLHVTIMNTLFRRQQNQDDALVNLADDTENSEGFFEPRQTRPKPPRITFDAKKILESFGDFDFGYQPFTELHISQRFARGNDGFYHCTAKCCL